MIEQFRANYRWLSNFVGGVEQAYQAAKCANQEDADNFLLMRPGEAKAAGKKVKLRNGWEKLKLTVMEDLIRDKFNHEPYRSKLLATGDETIQEGNTWGDKFWGVDLESGEGENHLGNLIMKIRYELRNQQ